MGYLKSACGISSSLCTAAVSTLDWFSPLGWGWQWCRGSGGAEAGQADEESCFKANPLFVRPQPLHLRGRTSDLSPLLPVFLLLLFEWLGFHGISVFLGWLKINSEVKNGEKKQYNVQAFSLVGEAPEITCHDDLFRENTVFFSGWSISLTLDDCVPGSPTSTPHRPSLCIQIRYISEVPAQFPLLIYKFLQYGWLCCLSNCKPSCSSRMPPRQTAGCACVPFISSLSFPRKHARYGSFTAPKGCSLRKPSRQLFQVVETLKWCGFRAVWPFVGISAVPRVYRISLWLSASCRRRAASLRHLGCVGAQREERAQQRGSSVSVEMWGFFLLIFPRFFFFCRVVCFLCVLVSISTKWG